MCIIHDSELHYLYQNIMVAFEQSQIISPTLTRRVACYLCTCKSDFLFSSRSIIAIQHKMFTWFEEEASNMLSHFKPIVDELKENGCVDSGTKIAFLNLLKDLDRRRRIQARAFGRDVRATRQEHVLRQARHARVRLEAVLGARVHASLDDHRSGRLQLYSNHQLEPNRVERRETAYGA